MKKLILILLGACSLASCKDFLNENSQSDIIPETTEHFDEILFSEGYPSERTDLHSWGIFLDDDLEAYHGPTVLDADLAKQGAAVFQWQPDYIARARLDNSPFYFNAWANYYKLILGSNVVLQLVGDAAGSEADKMRIKGEAYTLRAFYHFMLVNLYARPYNDSTTTPEQSPGIPIRTSADLADGYLARNTVKEVYAQIESDLDSAIMLLSRDKSTRSRTRITHKAAHLLASRVYLFEEKWDKAIAHADVVLDYHPQLMELNTWGGMPDIKKPIIGIDNVESIWCYGVNREKNPQGFGVVYDMSHNLADAFEDTDLRKLTGFYTNAPEMKVFFAPDFTQQKNLSLSDNGRMTTPNSWRSAEAYLNRAEAYIQLYKTAGDAGAAVKALSSLNTLRASRMDNSAFTPWAVQPAAQLLEMCREERRRELYMEEMHRWFDLRRYGMPAITHVYRPDALTTETYRLEARDPQYILPIPEEVLMRNPVLQQNPKKQGARLPL